MRTAPNLINRIEWAHRRLERAKRLIKDGLIQVAQTSQGPIYLCQSQTHQGKVYVVEPDACPCEDTYQVNGQKLCKHILARLILEHGLKLTEISKDPLYWQREKVSENGKPATRARASHRPKGR